MRKLAVLDRIGKYVEIEHGPFRPRSLAIVLGYGYRQLHGRGSPLVEDWTSRSGGSQVAVAMQHEDGSWTPEAVHLMSIHPHSEEES